MLITGHGISGPWPVFNVKGVLERKKRKWQIRKKTKNKKMDLI